MSVIPSLLDERSIFSYTPPSTVTPSAEEIVSENIDWLKVEDISDLGDCPAEIQCTLPDGIKIENRLRANGQSDYGLYATKFFKAHTIVYKGKLQLIRSKIGDYKLIIDRDGTEHRMNTCSVRARESDYKLIIDPDGTEYQMNIYKHLPHRTGDIMVWTAFSGFINHSCDPNCFGIQEIKSNKHSAFALRDIQPGEEITMDYCLSEYDMKGYIAQCDCRMASCRGSCEGFRYLNDDEKQKLSPYTNLYIQVQYLMEKKRIEQQT